jgi:hypothetical protein
MLKEFLLSKVITRLLSAFILCSAVNANAADTIAERSTKLEAEVVAYHQSYPVRSISTNSIAETAIAEGDKLQTSIQSLSADAESACYQRFLVNACIDDVRHLRRKLQDLVRRVTFEAKAYLRQQRGAKLPKDASAPTAEG